MKIEEKTSIIQLKAKMVLTHLKIGEKQAIGI